MIVISYLVYQSDMTFFYCVLPSECRHEKVYYNLPVKRSSIDWHFQAFTLKTASSHFKAAILSAKALVVSE